MSALEHLKTTMKFYLLLGNSTSFSFPLPLSFVIGVLLDELELDFGLLELLELGLPEN